MEAALVSFDNQEGPNYFFDKNDEHLLLAPTRSEQISDNTLFFSTIVPKGRNSILRIGTLSF